MQSEAVILVPETECKTAACNKVWSAATPGESKFANGYFFKVGTAKGYNPNPQAASCTPTSAKAGAGGGR
jgi:hypothetical protein